MGPKKRILVVDDAAFMRMMIRDILTKNNFEVAGEATNGEEAVSKYIELKPDLVTLDITMPGMDGVTVLKKIRQHDPAARVVMCSAMGQQAMVVEAIQNGARDFINKPFHPQKVVEILRRALR
ncbi:MAG: response regulator [Eubacteriales bacterium]|nr:response regulator [Eubacteriales bacterium]MDD3073561.1 response regulator [Eubacteriales bacterium]MDD4769642.1 response regulator [Eubacteriales bacterium]